MKNILLFFFGFIIIFAISINCFAALPGDCQRFFFYRYECGTLSSSSWFYNNFGFNALTGDISLPYSMVSGGAGTTYCRYKLFTSYFFNDTWNLLDQQNISAGQQTTFESHFPTDFGGPPIQVQEDLSSLDINKYVNGCESSCNDSDSDGVCDQCDVAPNDSSMGKTGYVKGYYEYNGKMVAGLTSFSPENSTYDAIEIYEHDPEIPGYVLGLGMPTYINESEFLAGGGKFIALQTPEQTYEMSCPSVTSLDQCEQIECEIKPVGSSATNELPNNGKGETEVAETEQKAEDAGMLDLDKTCDQLRSKCASSCGGATNIQSFACSENEHMVCQCLSNGSWELAKDWSEVGKQITITETTTVPSYGTGEISSGGGATTSVSGSSDGSLTGSYGYVEGNINYDTLSSHFSQFNSKFPFSLRSTLSSIYSDFKGTGAAPVYTYSVYGKTVTIDLAAWNDIAKMIRSFFALGITLSTIVLLIYLYVGIDLRGK